MESEQPKIVVNVKISITIENIDESFNERAQRIADTVSLEESERVRHRLQNDLVEEFGVAFVGRALNDFEPLCQGCGGVTEHANLQCYACRGVSEVDV